MLRYLRSSNCYYPVAGAMRIVEGANNTLYYVLKDRLGSASVVTDGTGAKVSEMRYCEASLWDKPCPLRYALGTAARRDGVCEGEVCSWWTASLSTTPEYKLAEYTL